MDSGANNSGPDDTDNGGCERDWGFETQHRHSLTRASDLSASGAELGDVGVLDDTLTDDDHRRRQMAGWRGLERALSFSHYTTEGIFIHGTLHLEVSWNLSDRGRLPPEDEERGWSGSFP